MAVGSVRGTRSFGVDNMGRLTGVTYRQVWTPGENLAKCHRPKEPAVHWLGSRTVNYFGDMIPSPSYILGYVGIEGSVVDVAYDDIKGVSLYSKRSIDETVEKAKAEKLARIKADRMEDCKHGFYAYFDGSDDYGQEDWTVSAVIEGYGEVVIGTRGFRCMKARILAICIEDGSKSYSSTRIRRNYPNIPIFTSYQHMLSEFPPSEEYIPSIENDPDFWTRDSLA